MIFLIRLMMYLSEKMYRCNQWDDLIMITYIIAKIFKESRFWEFRSSLSPFNNVPHQWNSVSKPRVNCLLTQRVVVAIKRFHCHWNCLQKMKINAFIRKQMHLRLLKLPLILESFRMNFFYNFSKNNRESEKIMKCFILF